MKTALPLDGSARLMLDACVLYPTVMRQVLLGAAEAGFFEPLWTARIAEEWARAAAKISPAQEAQARGEIALVRSRFPEAEVEEGDDSAFWLPDPADAHVLAAAAESGCDAICTLNAKDFPRQVLAREGLERVDPDTLLMACRQEDETRVAAVAEGVLEDARRLSGDDWEMRPLLRKARLPRLAKALGA